MHYYQLPPPPGDFSRFDIYAPLVQSLITFGPKSGRYSTRFDIHSSWQTLEFRARESTLLPNLKAFSLHHNFKQDEEPILWVSAFISPSLRSFNAVRVQRGNSAATSSTLSIILRLVARDCPNLESLTLFLGSSNRSQDGSSLWRIILEEPISHTWQNFRNLRSLVTDVKTLDTNSLLSLAQLQFLTTLEIRGTAQCHPYGPERLPTSARNATLAEDLFPSLRQITIRELHLDDIMIIWDLKPMVKRLTRLILLARRSLGEIATAQRLSSQFLAILCVRSPQLTDLFVNFMPCTSKEEVLIGLDLGHFKCLAALPLQRVEITRVLLCDPELSSNEPPIAGQIAALWPNVVELRLPDQRVTLAHLHYFAALRNLCHLVLDIDWDEGWPVQGPATPPPGDLPLHTLEFSKKVTSEFVSDEVEDLAKYVSFLDHIV